MIKEQIFKTDYKPNLDEFISQCEMNYQLILKLIPFLNIKKNVELSNECKELIKIQSKSGKLINFQLIEKAKYTTTMMLRLQSPSESSKNSMKLMVRLYHDAKLLEVMDVGPKALKPIIRGKHLSNRQADEKRQLNRFLGESLKYCLQT